MVVEHIISVVVRTAVASVWGAVVVVRSGVVMTVVGRSSVVVGT